MRVLATSLTLASLVALVACGDDTKPDDPGPPPPPPIDDTGDDGDDDDDDLPSGPHPIDYMYIQGAFGFDADSGLTAPVSYDGETYNSELVVLLLSDGYFDAAEADRPDHICAVVIEADGLAPQTWAVTDGWWAGFHLDTTAASYHTCDHMDYSGFQGLEPDEFMKLAFDWRFAIGGDPREADLESGHSFNLTPEEEPYTWGAGVTLADPGDPSTVYVADTTFLSTGIAVDESMNVIDDDGSLVPLMKEDVSAGGAVITGYYDFSAFYIYGI